MDRYRLIITPEAAADIEAIYEWIARDSVQNAGRVAERILQSIEGLAILPHRNVVVHRSDRTKYKICSLPVYSYLIYFRVTDDGIVYILTVRHGSRRKPKF